MQLNEYNKNHFNRGKSVWIEILWLITQAIFVSSWIPGSTHRKILLRLFGAKIGKGVNIKPNVRIKFPWRLEIGNYSWIGESVWIDNLASVIIGNNCCISQGVYLCTGSHNWNSELFDLITMPIVISDCVWLAAKSVVGPGVKIKEGAVLNLGSVATKDLREWWIHGGNPAIPLKERLRK